MLFQTIINSFTFYVENKMSTFKHDSLTQNTLHNYNTFFCSFHSYPSIYNALLYVNRICTCNQNGAVYSF